MEEDNYCPVCNHKLVMRYEGWVCKNWKCELYHKNGKGWVKYDKNSMLSKKNDINSMFRGSSSRWLYQQDLARLNQQILMRDKYLCQRCGDKYELCVHHIIPVSEDMNLIMNKDNMITLCKKCHDLVHSCDKRRFGYL